MKRLKVVLSCRTVMDLPTNKDAIAVLQAATREQQTNVSAPLKLNDIDVIV